MLSCCHVSLLFIFVMACKCHLEKLKQEYFNVMAIPQIQMKEDILMGIKTSLDLPSVHDVQSKVKTLKLE